MILIEDLKGCEKKAFTEITIFWEVKLHPDNKNILCLMLKSSLGKEEFCYQLYYKYDLNLPLSKQVKRKKFICQEYYTSKEEIDLCCLKEYIEKLLPGIVVKLQKVEK